jgi:hypothetical protein
MSDFSNGFAGDVFTDRTEIGGANGSYSMNDGSLAAFADPSHVICFAAGTRIDTPDGPRPVEDLCPGGLVMTLDDGAQPVRWIGQSLVAGVGDLAPVEIRPGGRFDVTRPLLVSPQHRMLVDDYTAELVFGADEVLVPAETLIDGTHIRRVERPLMTYVHVMLDRHQVIFAEGVATESFHPANDGLCTLGPTARAALFRAYPKLRADPDAYGPTVRPCATAREVRVMQALAA